MALLSILRQSLTNLCFSPKCDKQKPGCQKCITRDAVCTYPPSTPLVWIGGKANPMPGREAGKDSTELSPPAYSSSPQDEDRSITHDPSLNLENIYLIIHWFTTTVHIVNPISNPSSLHICQPVILNEVMQHNFLLHGLLALSALHLADSHPDPQKYTRIATAHHTQELALYHSIPSNINEANYSASIAFSSITIMFAFGLSRPQSSKAVGIELVNDIAQIFLLAKGRHKVVRIADDLECRAGSNIFLSHNLNTNSPSADTEAAFDRLHALNQGHDTALYTLAISSLKSVFETLAEEGNDNPHAALEWANTLPEEFVSLIRKWHGLALVIVAHYCVVLNTALQVWWLRGWGRGLFGVIWRSLDPNHRDALRWARLQVGFEV